MTAMARDGQHIDVRSLYDEAAGTISPAIYADHAIYELELERVFARSWLVVAHEGHVPRPGDYLASYMAEDPVIVVRQKDGSVKVLLNQCRHRGMKLCRADTGNARMFTCTYHGWGYDTAGRLVNVPFEDKCYPGLDKSQWGIRQARVETYKGLVFATWNEEAPPLREYLGDAVFYLDGILERSPAGSDVIGGIFKWTIPCNWKLAAEQFASDQYHVLFSHSSAIMAADFGDERPDATNLPGGQVRLDNGHASGFFQTDFQWQARMALGGGAVKGFDPTEPLERAAAHLGRPRAQLTAAHMTIFPNFSTLSSFDTARIWHPRGPDAVEVWAFGLIDKAASEAEREQARLATLRTFSPAGTFEQDDGENWVEVQRVLRGREARRTVFNMQMSMGEPKDVLPDFPGAIGNPYAEEAARGFYARWQELMLDAEGVSAKGVSAYAAE